MSAPQDAQAAGSPARRARAPARRAPPCARPRRGGRACGRIAGVLLVLSALSAPAAPQDGLLGEYFDDVGLTQLADTRVDPVIDFTTWGDAPTGTAVVPDDRFSERWTGMVRIPTAGSWTFSTVSNDGVRLWIDDVLLIDHWSTHAAATDDAALTLAAGWHPIRLEHFQQDGSVVIRLLYAGPGQGQVVVPQANLSTGLGNLPPTASAGPDQVVILPETSAVLAGAGDDPDGTIASWSWTQTAGPPATLSGSGGPSLTVTGLVASAFYRFRLTVTDDLGASDDDEAAVVVLASGVPGGSVSGELRMWHPVTVDFAGAPTSEQADPNPFRDLRLDVTFAHLDSGAARSVPGYFAADGDAADSGATGGDVWRARFAPDRAGAWIYQASFRSGPDVAASLDPTAGAPAGFDSATGVFEVAPADLLAPGFRAEGRLGRVGDHHLRRLGTRRPFLKGGANSPENLLAYAGFDQTTATHAYAPHVADWQPDDPTWRGGQGKGLIGALNYLAGRGMNVVYMLTFNVAGDGDDVWPWTSKSERLRFDVSKLEQWEVVFDHAERLGVMLHLVLQETENDDGAAALDGGELGLQRRLYHRELVARFGHHLGLQWNLGEENSNDVDELAAFHDHIAALDSDDHPIVLHTFPWQIADKYGPMLDLGLLDGTSLQLSGPSQVHEATLTWRAESAAHGSPWIVGVDEFGPASEGVLPDAVDPGHDTVRREALWGNLIAGGAGCEWYFGYGFAHDDLDCEDWRSRQAMWDQTRHALRFFERWVPFARGVPADGLVSGAAAWCLAVPGEAYALYLPQGGAPTLDLAGDPAGYGVSWYDPRQGGELQVGGVTSVPGGAPAALGPPPGAPGADWAVLLRALQPPMPPVITSATISPDPFPGHDTLQMVVTVTDENGLDDVDGVSAYLFTAALQFVTAVPMDDSLGPPGTYSLVAPLAGQLGSASWVVFFQARDAAGLEHVVWVPFESL